MNSKELYSMIRVSRGLEPCDCLFKGGMVLNVFTRKFERRDIAVHNGIIVGLDTLDRPALKTADVSGKYIVPGFIDSHVHFESSMLSLEHFADTILARGTIGAVLDPHEIANVYGMPVVRAIVESLKDIPADLYVNIPSCVPCTDLETSGAVITAQDCLSLKNEPKVLGLAEFMNYVGLLNGSEEVLDKAAALRDKHIDGHAPLLSGRDLQAYILSGISTDHECTILKEAEEKLAEGMYIMIREGSVTRDAAALAPIVNDSVLSRLMIATDDREPEDLINEGHIDFACRKLIKCGVRPEHAFIMASFNAAQCFGLKGLGAVSVGFDASFNVLNVPKSGFADFSVEKVYRKGILAAENGRSVAEISASDSLKPFYANSVFIKDYDSGCLRVKTEKGGMHKVHVIEAVPDSIVSSHLILDMQASAFKDENGEGFEIKADPDSDILKIAIFERHKATGNIGIGFLKGLHLKGGAIASTVAHDSHNLVVVGDNDADMLACTEEIKRIGGGLAVSAGGKVLSAPLPIAGLLSDRTVSEVQADIDKLYVKAKEMGCTISRPFMCLAFMGLPVVPHLKMTDKGLFDVDKFCFISAADEQ